MANITFKGQAAHTSGELPQVGTQAPNFELTTGELSEKTLQDFQGKKVLLNIFPSIDTGVCATSTRKFNEAAAGLDNTHVLCISNDLPFALNRFCAAEGLDRVTALSGFRSSFGEDYGLRMLDTPLKSLLSRAVVALDENGQVIYTEQVPEIGQEPNYEAALNALK